MIKMIPGSLLTALGFEHVVGVTVQLYSGARVRFTAQEIQVKVNDHNQIIGYRWTNAHDAPMYLNPERIESVVTKTALRRAQKDQIAVRHEADPVPETEVPSRVPSLSELIAQANEQAAKAGPIPQPEQELGQTVEAEVYDPSKPLELDKEAFLADQPNPPAPGLPEVLERDLGDHIEIIHDYTVPEDHAEEPDAAMIAPEKAPETVETDATAGDLELTDAVQPVPIAPPEETPAEDGPTDEPPHTETAPETPVGVVGESDQSDDGLSLSDSLNNLQDHILSVINTVDAEGRKVLSEGLALIARLKGDNQQEAAE